MKKDVIDNIQIIAKNLKKLRLIKEITAKELSRNSGVSISMISQIENLKQKPSAMTLRRILIALDYSLCLFLSQTQDEIPEFKLEPDKIVQKSQNRILLFEDKNGSKVELLRATLKGSDIATIEIKLMPDCRLFSDNIYIKGRVTGYILKGELLIEFQKDEHIVKPREEFSYIEENPFNFRNIGSEPVVILLHLKAINF